MLPLILLLLGFCGLWLAVKDLRDLRRREGDFSEWIVSDATPLNRRLWGANAWIRLITFPIVGVLCLVGALQAMLGK